MPITALSLKIETPTEPIPFGRGFYQLEEETLYLPIEYPNQKPTFFSHLEADRFTLHIDKFGRLIFIELNLPRHRWTFKEDLIMPEETEPADIRFLDFRQKINQPDIFCNRSRELLMFRFAPGPSSRNIKIAGNLIAQVSDSDQLVAIWAYDLIDDIAGREISSWRKSIHGTSSHLSPSQVSYQKKC